jgi:hypothetical protein
VTNRCERWRIVAKGGESLRKVVNRCERWRIVAKGGESLRKVVNRCESWRTVESHYDFLSLSFKSKWKKQNELCSFKKAQNNIQYFIERKVVQIFFP